MVGSKQEILCKALLCRDLNYMSIPGLETGEALRCKVSTRYRHPGQDAVLEGAPDGLVRVTFDSPVQFAAPGQSAVFYDENACVIGGGIISDVSYSAAETTGG